MRTRAAVAGVVAAAVVIAGAVVIVARLAGHGRSARVPVSGQLGGSVTLGAARLSVPPGAVSGRGYLQASTGGASPPTGGMGTGLALAGASAPVHFQVTGARLSGALRVTFRVSAIGLPRSVPASARGSAVWLAYYDLAARRWQPVASRYDPGTGTVTAQVRHLSWWAPWTWDWQGFALRLRQALSALGSGRALAQSCPGAPKVTVTSAGGQDPPLIGCAASRSGGKLTVSITNNRGISAVMSQVPPDATQDPATYTGFYEYVASRDAVTRALGGADLPPSATLTYSLPLSGPPAAFTAAPTVPSYVLDLASAAGDELLDEAEYGKVSGSYATCVLNAVARSEPASFADAPRLAVQCLPALAKAVPALSGLDSPVLRLIQHDAQLLLQDYDLAHDDIRGVSGKVTITRSAPGLAACTSAAMTRSLSAHGAPKAAGWQVDSLACKDGWALAAIGAPSLHPDLYAIFRQATSGWETDGAVDAACYPYPPWRRPPWHDCLGGALPPPAVMQYLVRKIGPLLSGAA